MGHFNPIPEGSIRKVLVDAGFKESKSGKEVVFERANHKDPRLKVRVFTSIKVGSETVRKKGADAIRVVLVFQDKKQSFGVCSAKRVFRSGATDRVLNRMLERMREIYGTANKMAAGTKCKCGAPAYLDSGRCIRRACTGCEL